MSRIIVAGLINIETNIKIDGFPIDYVPVRYPFYGVETSVGGVGYNITKALKTLGHEVDFLSMLGQDNSGQLVRQELAAIGVTDKHVLGLLDATPQSAIFYDGSGKRMINTDLKAIQETLYPLVHLDLAQADLAVLCNINFSRPMLKRAKTARVPIATDVHVIRNLDDDYNRDYMAAADMLFMSDEGLPVSPEAWIQQLWQRYGTPIVVIGLGANGALLGVQADKRIEHIPAYTPRPIVNTIGSGDALFSAFIHTYASTKDPYVAIRKAVLFAGYKIGANGAALGFLNAAELDNAYGQYYGV